MDASEGSKENAKTRYNAKKPTVSFRVSREERERLDELRKRGTSFREMVLKGAGIIENAQVRRQELRESERKNVEQAAIARSLKQVSLCTCHRCGKPMYWDLTNPYHIRQITEALEEKRYRHNQCPGRLV